MADAYSDPIGAIDNSVDKMVDANEKAQAISVEFYNNLKKFMDDFVKGNKIEKSQISEVGKQIKEFAKLYGANTKATADLDILFKKLDAKLDKGDSVEYHKLLAGVENLLTELRVITKRKEAGGSGEIYFNPKVQRDLNKKWDEEILEKMNKKQKSLFDDARDGITSFMGGEYYKKNVKALKTLSSDIVQGLAANKFIGGGIKDSIRLMGLLAAQKAKKLPGGKFIAPVVYGFFEALAPLLTTVIISAIGIGITKAFPGLLTGLISGSKLKNLFQVAGGASKARTVGTAGTFVLNGKEYTTAAGASKVSSLSAGKTANIAGTGLKAGLKTGLKKALPVVGVGLDAINAYVAAKEGNVASAVLSTLGAITAIGTVIAGAVGAGGPLILILGALSVISSFLGSWKRTSEQSQKELNETVRDIREETLGDKIKELASNVGGAVKEGIQDVKTGAENLTDRVRSTMGLPTRAEIKDEKAVEQIGSLGINKYGAMTNIRQMDKMQASEAVRAYMRTDPERFKRGYELVDNKYAYVSQFKNDLALRDEQGRPVQAVLSAGASGNLEFMWDALEAAGMKRDRAELMKYTAGRATKDSSHKTHNDLFNMITDLGTANQWTDDEWELAFNTLKPLLAKYGYNVKWEGKNKSGKTVFGDKFVRGLSNRHFHVDVQKGLVPSEVVEKIANYEPYEAAATQHNLEIRDYIKDELTEEEKEKVSEEFKKDSSRSLEEILKKLGLLENKNNELAKIKPVDNDSSTIDYTGNRTFLGTLQRTINDSVVIGIC